MSLPDNIRIAHRTGRRRRIWLAAVILAWGIQAIVTQSLLIREALVLMFGSEFAWGVVLFAWLFGVAIGAAIGGRISQHVRRADFVLVAVLTALSAAACVELWVFRSARAWLGVGPGELLSLPTTALAAVLFVSPASALVGMAFPLACRVTGGGDDTATAPSHGLLSLGRVYAVESFGSLMGGAAFSFWAVEHLSPIATALVCGVITTAASAGLLLVTARRRLAAGIMALLCAGGLLTCIFGGESLNRRLVSIRWHHIAPGYELKGESETRYQNLALGQLERQFTLYSDGQVSADFPDPYTFEPLAHFWMCQHPAPRTLLVLGGGAEGLLAQLLRRPIEHIDYVEPDPKLIELIEPYLTDADRSALVDPRVTLHTTDARYFIKTQANRFDLVIARLPEPLSALRARLYTDEFYRELRRAMTPRSVLCLTAAAMPGQLSAASAEYLATIRATLKRHFPTTTIGWGNPAHILAATEKGLLALRPAELIERYTRRGVEPGWFDPAWFDGANDWLDPTKVRLRESQLDAVEDPDISTDLRPIVYVQRLSLWESATAGAGGRGRPVFALLRSIGWGEIVGALIVIVGLTLSACYVRSRLQRETSDRPAGANRPQAWLASGAVIVSVGTTGLATMALGIIWLFAFQNLYGYVYQRIGWIIAVFMGGLVVGCGVVSLRMGRLAPGVLHGAYLWRRLVVVDLLLALLALVVPFALPGLGSLQTGPAALVIVEWSVLLMVALTGVLGGAAFALAGGLTTAMTGRVGAAAGSVVGADHAGACLGALLAGVLLVPVFGTSATACLLAGVKLGSVALLLAGKKASGLAA